LLSTPLEVHMLIGVVPWCSPNEGDALTVMSILAVVFPSESLVSVRADAGIDCTGPFGPGNGYRVTTNLTERVARRLATGGGRFRTRLLLEFRGRNLMVARPKASSTVKPF